MGIVVEQGRGRFLARFAPKRKGTFVGAITKDTRTHSTDSEAISNSLILGTMQSQTDSSSTPTQQSPQEFLDDLLRSRGYSTERFETLQTAYYNKPTPLQKASYHLHMAHLVRTNNAAKLGEALKCGLSPNPCNEYGESLLHTICRRGKDVLLRVMLENGSSLAVSDDFGRTPLHDACWMSASFDVVQILLQHHVRRLFFLADSRGSLPLDYVQPQHYGAWIQFLDSHKDEYWPVRSEQEEPCPLALQGANTHPIPDPFNALTLELAAMVASGRMEPDEAVLLRHDESSTEDVWSDDEEDWSQPSENNNDDYDDILNENEMEDILNKLSALNASRSGTT